MASLLDHIREFESASDGDMADITAGSDVELDDGDGATPSPHPGAASSAAVAAATTDQRYDTPHASSADDIVVDSVDINLDDGGNASLVVASLATATSQSAASAAGRAGNAVSCRRPQPWRQALASTPSDDGATDISSMEGASSSAASTPSQSQVSAIASGLPAESSAAGSRSLGQSAQPFDEDSIMMTSALTSGAAGCTAAAATAHNSAAADAVAARTVNAAAPSESTAARVLRLLSECDARSAALAAEATSLQAALASANAAVARLTKENEVLRADSADLKVKFIDVVNATAKHSNIATTNQVLTEQVAALRAQVSDERDAARLAQSHLTATRIELAADRREAQALGESFRHQLRSLREEVHAGKAEVSRLQALLAARGAEVAALKQQAAADRRTYEQQLLRASDAVGDAAAGTGSRFLMSKLAQATKDAAEWKRQHETLLNKVRNAKRRSHATGSAGASSMQSR